MKLSEFLGKARDHIAKGWCQNDYSDGEGNVCAMGALYAAGGQKVHDFMWLAEEDSELIDESVRELCKKVRELGGASIISYNDAEGVTQQDVLNLFDKTIAGLEESGS